MVHFAATLDADTKKKVVPELVPRVLFWFRWGAAWTWITGVLLFNDGVLCAWNAFKRTGAVGRIDMGYGCCDVLGCLCLRHAFQSYGSHEGINYYRLHFDRHRNLHDGVVGQGFSYRGYNIHIGALFGTIMAFNVWFRIWPAQQKIITAIKNGEAPDAKLAGLAGMRSKHNTYLSVPLFWAMINGHTSYFAGGNLGITKNWAPFVMMAVTLLGWHIVWHCYKKGGKIKGF